MYSAFFSALTLSVNHRRVILPVSALVDQYKSVDSALVKQLDLSAIQHSLERLDDHERRELIPKILKGLAQDEGQSRANGIFYIVLRLLLDVRIPPRGSKEDTSFRESIGLSDPADAKYLASFISLFIRLSTPRATSTWKSSNKSFSPEEIELVMVDDHEPLKVFQRMTELKRKLVELLASGAFTDEEKFLPALYATTSLDTRVSSTAEEILKRSAVSMEDEALISRLFRAHSSLTARYRTRILNLLAKSTLSTTMPEQIMAVVNLDFGRQGADFLHPQDGLERKKLHTALFQYLSWVAHVGPSSDALTISAPLISNMRSYIQAQGWPRPEDLGISVDEIALRSKAYETIGVLARSATLTSEERLSLASWLFKSLSEDPTDDAVISIDGAMSSLTMGVPVMKGHDAELLKTLLLKYMALDDEWPVRRSTRHAVVKWANQCLEFSDIIGRWIDVLAVGGRGDERSDVVEQGLKGLDPWTYFAHVEAHPSLPDWKAMVLKFFGPPIDHISHTDQLSLLESGDQPMFQNYETQPNAISIVVRYIKSILFLTALDDFKVEPDWQQTLNARVRTDIKTREKIRAYLHTVDSGYVVLYLKACFLSSSHGCGDPSPATTEECLRCFVEVASLSPHEVAGVLSQSLPDTMQYLESNTKEIRSLGASAAGILVPHVANPVQAVMTVIDGLFSASKSEDIPTQPNRAEGALLAIGHIVSRYAYYGRGPVAYDSWPLRLLSDEASTSSMYDAALASFAQLWTAGLAIPPREGDHTLESVVQGLAKEAKKGNEKTILALGRLANGLEDESGDDLSNGILGSIMQELFALHTLKRVEIQFTVGEAITAAVARWDSDYLKLTMDVEREPSLEQKGARKAVLVALLDKLFEDCKATKPSLLKASGIWLFCIVQYCSHVEEVQSRLRETQAAFMRLLSARDELVQETASRGLSLVYERGDAELKNTLVKDLVSSFTGSGPQLKVDQETELFEPGALPTGEGSSITSYKDIVSLANEVGDQRLVYKFMSLATNAATWSTRSAFGRFGLSSILSDSEVDPKLWPKLFRYRFDPNQNVARSMDHIWKALAKDSATVVDTHFDAILEDLLKAVVGREWRMREASCAAISDLIHGRPFPQYEKLYRDIWAAALKVLDDVKGSVREAALRLCITLSKGLVRQLEDGGDRSAPKAMMKEALPFLLSDKGVESSVQEVQIFAISTVINITKKGGKSLKPFIPEMVPQLLGLLSSIEPQAINYHYQRVSEDSRDQIDKARSMMVNQSPLSEAIENCLRFIDKETMAELAPRLESTIKGAIGMPTKLGCTRVLTTLFTRHTADVAPFSRRFLRLMEKQTMDKNDEVSRAYAGATAYIMRSEASVAADEWFCKKFINMYLEAEEESRRQKVADVILALGKLSSDKFAALETDLLPFAYLGAHDTDKYTRKVFEQVWSQHAGTSRTVVRYAKEIALLVERCLDTQRWALRDAGALTLAAMVKDLVKASEASGQIGDINFGLTWPLIDRVLALKTFSGKEKLLEVYPEFVEKSSSSWGADPKIAARMKTLALREAKRNNDEYRLPAFRALWKFARARNDLDLLDDIADIVTPRLDDFNDDDSMDVDSNDMAEKTASNGLEAIARGYGPSKIKEDPLAVLGKVMGLLKPYLSRPKFAIIKRQVWYECVHDLMEDAAAAGASKAASDEQGVAVAYLLSLDLDLVDVGTEPQRVMRAKAAGALLKAKARGAFGKSGPGLEEFKEMLNGALRMERSLDVQRVLRDILTELA